MGFFLDWLLDQVFIPSPPKLVRSDARATDSTSILMTGPKGSDHLVKSNVNISRKKTTL